MKDYEIIKQLMEEQNIKQIDFVNKFNMPRSNVSLWMNGKRKIPKDKLFEISKILNVSLDYLMGSENAISIRTIPLIGLASCGVPQNYDMNGYEPVPVSASMYRDGMYAVKAEGESMSPKINDRNIVYCCAEQQINSGDIVHYSINGESGIKKYKMNERGDTISLVPLNTDYDVITIYADDNMAFKMSKVVGVVDTDF